MSNRSEEELILALYGEHPEPEAIAAALAADADLRRRYAELQRDLAALAAVEPPAPRPGLEGRLWARLQPQLSTARQSRRGTWLGRPLGRLAWGTLAAAALLALGFVAGRASWRPPSPAPEETRAALGALPVAARQRVLAAAIVEHLASSERLLVQVSNDDAAAAEERRWAETLLDANRLYRRAAERAGQRRVAALLGELEPLFAELANAPADRPAADLRAARERIADHDLLFKVRITRSNI